MFIGTSLVDSPKQRHGMISLSTKDMTYGLSINPTVHFESRKEGTLSTKNKSAEYMLYTKCPNSIINPKSFNILCPN
jgi:hypothetical protein